MCVVHVYVLTHAFQSFSVQRLTLGCCFPACPGRFQCSNNLCIDHALHCDGWNDCGDGSDEMNCSESEHDVSARRLLRSAVIGYVTLFLCV